MLSALARGDALEILVLLKDMSAQGLTNLRRNIALTEAKVNTTSFGGFTSKTKTLAADAEKAAGKKGGTSGVLGLASAFTGLPGPILIAGAALAAFAALSAATVGTYENSEHQLRALDIALKAHGDSLDNEKVHLDEAIKTGVKYGMNASDVREGVLKLVEAGVKFSDIQKKLPAIMSLAIAKHISMAEASDLLAKATVGQGRGLTDLGIKVQGVSVIVTDHKKAVHEASIAARELKIAQQELADLAAKHGTSVQKLNAHTRIITTTTKGHAASLTELEKAQLRVTKAHDKLVAAQAKAHQSTDVGNIKAQNFEKVTAAVTGAVGDQQGSVTDLTKATTNLSDAWDRFATVVGPAVTGILTTVVGLMSNLVDFLSSAFSWFGKFLDSLPKSNPLPTSNPYPGGGQPLPYRGRNPSPTPPRIGGPSAAGGPVGLSGPEWRWVGEKGPEYVVPNHQLGMLGGGGGTHVHFHTLWPPTEQQVRMVADLLDRHEYWRGTAGAATGNRT